MKRITVTMTKQETILGYIYLALQLTVLPVVLVLLNTLFGTPLSDSQVNFLFFLLNFLCTTVILRRFLIANTKIAIHDLWRCLQSAFFGLALYWILSIGFGLMVQWVYPDFFNVNDDSIGQLMAENALLIRFGTVLLVPVTEELLYRGLIFRSLYRRSPLSGYVISTAVFAALHVVSYIGMYEPLHLTLCFLQYLPAGFCLAWAYARADTIWAPILIHITVNQIGTLSMR